MSQCDVSVACASSTRPSGSSRTMPHETTRGLIAARAAPGLRLVRACGRSALPACSMLFLQLPGAAALFAELRVQVHRLPLRVQNDAEVATGARAFLGRLHDLNGRIDLHAVARAFVDPGGGFTVLLLIERDKDGLPH